ncbi:hypothetical protein F4779DRAFT_582780 [Xylariaceae sp. FL0662B]|nr:hypothetical protein F4779DRAFT_582780 [Xylariaceae sp. FL0662B]
MSRLDRCSSRWHVFFPLYGMMHHTLSSKWLNAALNIAEHPAKVELPLFLSPSINILSHRRGLSSVASSPRFRDLRWRPQGRRCLHMQADSPTATLPDSNQSAHQHLPVHKLPRQCRGCGALSQTVHPNQPGYFDLHRKALQKYLGTGTAADRSRHEDKIYEDALKHFDHKELEKQGVDVQALAMSIAPMTDTGQQPPPKVPLCDRCHYLLHNNTGQSIYHPTIDSIRDTILESPYKYNHVYHILDAADFPMSILPNISKLLDLMPLRSQNRRSKGSRFYGGKKTELSFIITRADLLAPRKEQVDQLFPYLREVLREALGRSARNVRLGNLAAVSAQRNWWTKELKEDIWKRGGAGWMVGKVNVGKSRLFGEVFPKGRMDTLPSKHQISVDMRLSTSDKEVALAKPPEEEAKTETEMEMESTSEREKEEAEAKQLNELLSEDTLDEYSLLPPAPEEALYPEMPLVSALPGTTASPIRVPFGNGRGELIDLPGLQRSTLEQYVKKEHHSSLVMRSRIVPKQTSMRPNQSLLLGGFIRITPREPAVTMLTYAFTPIKPHTCRTHKAISIQEQAQIDKVNVENIAEPETSEKIEHAGSFELNWDVTKERTGPLTRKNAVGLSVERLPYRVLSTDILIEGVGWVELVAQVRTKDLYARKPSAEEPEPPTPEPEEEKQLSAMERLEALAEDPKKKKKREQSPTQKLPEKKEFSAPERSEATGRNTSRTPNYPVVDIYTPEGKFVSSRRPMGGWLLNKPREKAKSLKTRPRKSMKGVKRFEKKRKREREASAASF